MESLTPRPPTGVDELDSTAHARSTDPITSHLAAAKVDLSRRQVQVLRAFQEKATDDHEVIGGFEAFRPPPGLTDEELVKRVQERVVARSSPGVKVPSPSGLRTARKALQEARLVEKHETTRQTTLGNYAHVWVLTEAGRAFVVPQ